jgi:hypothetical protein
VVDDEQPPLDEDESEGVLGAVVETFLAGDDEGLAALGEALRHGGRLTARWSDDPYGQGVVVILAVPPGLPLRNCEELEDRALDVVRRAVATCGPWVQSVHITLALAKAGWRSPPKEDLPVRLGDRYDREPDPLKVGGFGVIYKARDRMTGADVALKVLRLPGDAVPAEREQYHLRFRREMQVMDRHRHPHLMEVLFYGQQDNGALWYVMPLAAGSLADRVEEFVDDPHRSLAVLTAICEAVGYLHDNGIVHRDLSPGNVLFMPDGRWVVADLGLAFDLDRTLTQLTSTGMAMGTIGYRPPDAEARMAKDATAQWDIYSLGQILADMTAGQTFRDRMGAVPVSVFKPAILRATAADPERRFATVTDFLDECRQLLELESSWEGPDERRSRLAAALDDLGDAREAAHELALLVAQGESVEPFASAICRLRGEAQPNVDAIDAEDLRNLTLAIIDGMPGSWTPFEQLDDIAAYLVAAADALDDDEVAEKSLVWLLDTGHHWNRWNVQGIADRYLRRLAEEAPPVVARALAAADPAAVPADLEWMHPAARPLHSRSSSVRDEEPF